MTQNENIADTGGLSHAYAAYRKYASAHGAENRLPGLRELSPEQLFFVGFASVSSSRVRTPDGSRSRASRANLQLKILQIWCESTTEQTLMNDLLTDVHSPGRIRVLGALSNSVEFAEAFRCPTGSPMNPSEKCNIL